LSVIGHRPRLGRVSISGIPAHRKFPHKFIINQAAALPESIQALRLSVPKTPSIGFANTGESEHDCWMFAIAFLFVRLLCDRFKSRRRLEAEILVLRHQINVLQLRAPRRLCLTWGRSRSVRLALPRLSAHP
jgi:hypothetical protein